MATYNKRGYKAPKPKEDNTDDQYIDNNVAIDAKDSTTAEVFNTLDESASRTEDFVARNQKIILGIVGILAVAAIAYMLYAKFVVEPKEVDATKEMYVAQKNFQLATDGTASDSLFNLALNGAEGKLGFVKIADDFSGTDAGNLANYYAGMAYLNTGKFDEAIMYLDKFSTDDVMLKALAIGAIGDAHAQKNQMKEALDFYQKALSSDENDFTTPRFTLKAGQTALSLGNKEEALKMFTIIKEKYENAPEAQGIDALIGLAQ
jgi:tetratricopeptide (TPR) repeat protein